MTGLRIPPGAVEVLLPRTDDAVLVAEQPDEFWDLVRTGQWEDWNLALVSKLVGPGRTFIDIGAWIGPLTLLAARLGAEVIAFEPDPYARDKLEANLALNPDIRGRVTIIPKALATRQGTARLASTELGNSMASLVHGGKDATRVETLDARRWANGADFSGAALVKMDVEGAEFSLLPRMRRALSRSRPAMLVSVHGYHLYGRFPRLPRRAAWAAQHLVSLAARSRLIFAARSYRLRWRFDGENGRWQSLPRWGGFSFLTSMGGAELFLADDDVFD